MAVSPRTKPRRARPTHSAPKRARPKRSTLDRAAWIAAAREVLIARGIRAVKIETLSAGLGVTREAFYWHFDKLADLHREMVRDWELVNSAAYRGLLDPARHDDNAEFRGVGRLFARENYSPAWDLAVRDWARQSKDVASVVTRVDKTRLDIIEQVFRQMGYSERDALIRARVTYFHQMGEQRVGLEESNEERAKFERAYFMMLILGHPSAD